jgi:Endoribonuclease L-PSP
MSTLEHPRPEELFINPAFSQVVAASGTRTIYTAGQVSIDAQGKLVGAGDLAAQTAQAMRNVGLALAAAGAGFADVVKITNLCRELCAGAADHYQPGAGTVLRGRAAAGEHPAWRRRARAAGVAGRDRGRRGRRLTTGSRDEAVSRRWCRGPTNEKTARGRPSLR